MIDPTDFENVRAQRDRDRRDATIYSLEVYEADDGAFVVTQQDGELEALGYSHAGRSPTTRERSTPDRSHRRRRRFLRMTDPDAMSTGGIEHVECFCGGEHDDWDYHSEEGCAATGQAFAFVRGGCRVE